jgi:hypothetical protein
MTSEASIMHYKFQVTNLDANDQETVERVDESLTRLATRRKERIEAVGPFARSKLAWKAAVFQQVILYRVVMLADGVIANWNSGNILASFLAARALIETIAVLDDFECQLQLLLANSNLEGIDNLVMNRTFATRDVKWLQDHPSSQSINILTAIDKFDRDKLSGIRRHYDLLSERCHPNALGHHQFFSTLDTSNGTVTFSEKKYLDANFRHVFAAVILAMITENSMDRLDAAIHKTADLQHSQNPAPNAQ